MLVFTNKKSRPLPSAIVTRFFTTIPWKFAVLSITTMGLYQVYWFYRNWKLYSRYSRIPMSPFWRTFFFLPFSYCFFSMVKREVLRRNAQDTMNPLVITILYVLVIFAILLPRPFCLIGFLSFYPLVIVQKSMLTNQTDSGVVHYASTDLKVRHFLVIVIGGGFVFFAYFIFPLILSILKLFLAIRFSS